MRRARAGPSWPVRAGVAVATVRGANVFATWAASKRISVTIVAVAQVAAMALWFSASAVTPALAAEFHLSHFFQAFSGEPFFSSVRVFDHPVNLNL